MKRSYKSLYSIQYTVYSISGQSLIEVVIAISIAAILAISVISTSLLTQKTSTSAKNNTTASKLAQEGIELIRVLRDRKGFDKLYNSNQCLMLVNEAESGPGDLDLKLEECTVFDNITGDLKTLNKTSYYRQITIHDGNRSNEKLIIVKVIWEESGGQQMIISQTYLSRWEDAPFN